MLTRNLCLSAANVEILKELIVILKPIEAVSRELSADEYVSASKIIPLARSLQRLITGPSIASNKVGEELASQMTRRFLSMESNLLLGAATMLDPRLKKCAFGADDTVAIDKILRSIKAELVHAVSSHENSTSTEFTDEMEDQGEVEETTLAVGQSGGDETLWQFVDQRVAETSRVHTPTVDATVEVDQYMKQKNIARKEDPLVWWQNKNVYPNLQYLARKYLSVPASLSSERLFSKAGEFISARRSTLKEKNINMYLFLNKNFKILQ